MCVRPVEPYTARMLHVAMNIALSTPRYVPLRDFQANRSPWSFDLWMSKGMNAPLSSRYGYSSPTIGPWPRNVSVMSSPSAPSDFASTRRNRGIEGSDTSYSSQTYTSRGVLPVSTVRMRSFLAVTISRGSSGCATPQTSCGGTMRKTSRFSAVDQSVWTRHDPRAKARNSTRCFMGHSGSRSALIRSASMPATVGCTP